MRESWFLAISRIKKEVSYTILLEKKSNVMNNLIVHTNLL